MPELELDTVFEAEEKYRSSDDFESSGQNPGISSSMTDDLNPLGVKNGHKRPSNTSQGISLVPPSLAEAKRTMKVLENKNKENNIDDLNNIHDNVNDVVVI